MIVSRDGFVSTRNNGFGFTSAGDRKSWKESRQETLQSGQRKTRANKKPSAHVVKIYKSKNLMRNSNLEITFSVFLNHAEKLGCISRMHSYTTC